MFLAYVTTGNIDQPRQVLCLIPDKPDQFSALVPVDSLTETVSAYHRISPLEVLVAIKDEQDGGLCVQAVEPSKIYITPNMHDKPGLAVSQLKVQKTETGHLVSYIQEGDPSANWKEWNPKKRGLRSYTGGVAVD